MRARFGLQVLPSEDQRAQGIPGARCARSLARNKKAYEHSHHGHTGSPGIPRAMVYGYFVLSPVTGLFCHCRSRITRDHGASVGASGPHDFAVRKPTLSSSALPASTASRPASVTIASRPSCGTGLNRNTPVSTWLSRKIRKIRNRSGPDILRAGTVRLVDGPESSERVMAPKPTSGPPFCAERANHPFVIANESAVSGKEARP